MKDSNMTTLVTGATGAIGSRVVERLLERGNRPAVFVRDPERARARYGDRVKIIVGDLADPGTLVAALAGVNALFLVTSGPKLAERDEAAANAAKAAGVKRLVKLSSMDARQGVGTGVWHAQGESAIRASGIAFTFVQPAGFMSNALEWATSISAEGVVRAPTADGRIAFIHPDDIAAVATEVLMTCAYDGKSLPITGPEALSYVEMTAKIAAVIGKALRFQTNSEDEERRHMIENGDPAEIITAHLSIYQAIREGRLAAVSDTVQEVLGRKPITFDQWATENAEAFLGGGLNVAARDRPLSAQARPARPIQEGSRNFIGDRLDNAPLEGFVEGIMVERKSLGFSPPDRSEQLARVAASIAKGVSKAELAEQKASFIYGNAPVRSGITKDSARYAAENTRLTTIE
jgi:uncharacterized protein YbjT (DUF2867 family)